MSAGVRICQNYTECTLGVLPVTRYAPTGLASAVHCTAVEFSNRGWTHTLSPMYTTGSGLVAEERRPRLVPVTWMTTLVSAGAAATLTPATLTPVTAGASYRKGTLAFPAPPTVTRRRTSPKPGPAGAVQRSTPSAATPSVTTTFPHASSPMVTVVALG